VETGGIHDSPRDTNDHRIISSDTGNYLRLINGDSGERNQRTIAKFKKALPEIHVIVSTEAGSEGVNLQAANVLVNYDLPWNPMIVEQRIGRIQRLASEHASVCICNIILRGTFEEYIVGRLMEKLQLASHAIGDIEALLEAAGMNEQNEDGLPFEEMIRQLVIASLAAKTSTRQRHLRKRALPRPRSNSRTKKRTSTRCSGRWKTLLERRFHTQLAQRREDDGGARIRSCGDG